MHQVCAAHTPQWSAEKLKRWHERGVLFLPRQIGTSAHITFTNAALVLRKEERRTKKEKGVFT
jgi:hypothetical protein